MKKIALLFVAFVVLASCRQKSTGDKENIEKQIIEYQHQVRKINQKIIELQQQLDEIRMKEKNGSSSGLVFRVKTRKVHRRPFKHSFEAVGELQAVNEAFISPEINGQIKKILVNEGDFVKKGQLLAKLETEIIENNIKELKTSLELATLTYNKQKELWEKNIGSEMQYLQAKTKKETLERKLKTLQLQYDKSFIKSPLDGYVEAVNLKEGELASPAVRFIHVVNLDELYVNADLSEAYLPVVHEGDTVEVRFAVFKDIKLKVPVYRTGNVINKQSRTFRIQLKIKNIDKRLKPNMLATLTINDYYNPSAIVVPSELIKEDIKGDYMYVLAKKSGVDIAQKRYIKTGKSTDDYTEVIEGLSESDIYITDGYNNVSDGAPVTVEN